MGAFEDAGNRLILGASVGMQQAATEIMVDALYETPLQTGTMRRSARVNPPISNGASITCSFGFGYGDEINPNTRRLASEYAVPLHERTWVRHPPPTKAKFLEDAVLLHANRIGATIGATMQVYMGRGVFKTGKPVAGQMIYDTVASPFAGTLPLPIEA